MDSFTLGGSLALASTCMTADASEIAYAWHGFVSQRPISGLGYGNNHDFTLCQTATAPIHNHPGVKPIGSQAHG
ncbi:hypothetical protein GQ53DRAFT_364540 [Thozetella sp. PMI_491]|nr:hypothetical protein GQ53DRAFT_364540 [Thozetella sp. PMI_491]